MELKRAGSQVYSLEDLQLVADLAKEHNVAVISDEVYEYLVYPPNKHHRIGVPCVYVCKCVCVHSVETGNTRGIVLFE